MKTEWSLGFEIEGIFSDIYTNLKKSGYNVSRKEDGSVHDLDIMRKYGIGSTSIDGYTEYNVGVFKDIDEMIKTLKEFKNGKNYFMDESCGLHLHIKPSNEKIKELFWDLDFVEKLERYAFTSLCKCQAKRKENRFCMTYRDLDHFIEEVKYQEKYRFVRNHPSGTLEFRFFSPCEHKSENMKKFLNYMFKLLDKQEPKKSNTIELYDFMHEQKKNFSFPIVKNVSNNYDYKLEENINVDTDVAGTGVLDNLTFERAISSLRRATITDNIDDVDDEDDEEESYSDEIPF